MIYPIWPTAVHYTTLTLHDLLQDNTLGLNPQEQFICEQISKDIPLGKIVSQFSIKYNLSSQKAQELVVSFLLSLNKQGLLNFKCRLNQILNVVNQNNKWIVFVVFLVKIFALYRKDQIEISFLKTQASIFQQMILNVKTFWLLALVSVFFYLGNIQITINNHELTTSLPYIMWIMFSLIISGVWHECTHVWTYFYLSSKRRYALITSNFYITVLFPPHPPQQELFIALSANLLNAFLGYMFFLLASNNIPFIWFNLEIFYPLAFSNFLWALSILGADGKIALQALYKLFNQI